MMSGCPVKGIGRSVNNSVNMDNNSVKTDTSSNEGQSACPVKHSSSSSSSYRYPKQYNVYSQEINPDNNMPLKAQQKPLDPRSEALPTQRVSSTIPKGGKYHCFLVFLLLYLDVTNYR
jgi:hypothetical protein